jgi:hypothetical protein
MRTTAALAALLISSIVFADGKMFGPRSYKGSLEEKSQEAIIIFHASGLKGDAVEDLILKVSVKGQTDRFAWVIPFPSEPEIRKEEAALFKELFEYVQDRISNQGERGGYKDKDRDKDRDKDKKDKGPDPRPVDVLSRKVVGAYDVAVVRENVQGALNDWLKTEGFQDLGDAAETVGFYRDKGYVFACIKVKDATPSADRPTELHPLRFTFKTGGRDGIYFPMKLTGTQKDDFRVNLYVFYRLWINDDRSKYGYVHRGMRLEYRDWDTSDCVPNGGKDWSAPETDPFLRKYASRLSEVTRLFQKLHPGERYYLTNIRGTFRPADVRDWNDDLWLFPYYTNPKEVPHDARVGGPAAGGWPHDRVPEDYEPSAWTEPSPPGRGSGLMFVGALGIPVVLLLCFSVWLLLRRRTVRLPG